MQKKETKTANLDLGRIKKMIIHEDDHRLVRDKPAHMLIHPGDKHTTDITMHDIMASYLKLTDQRNATQTYAPSFCYRLDKDTSGVVISAKTYEALQYLNQLIRERETFKEYTTILVGDMSMNKQTILSPDKGKGPRRGRGLNSVNDIKSKNSWETILVTAPLFVGYNRSTWRSQTFVNREKGKESKTEFHLMKTINHKVLGPLSLVNVKLYTGRMHQIRVHAAHMWFPVLWDLTYWTPAANRLASKKCSITRQLLHASSYWFFDHFGDKQLTFSSSLPDEFEILFEK